MTPLKPLFGGALTALAIFFVSACESGRDSELDRWEKYIALDPKPSVVDVVYLEERPELLDRYDRLLVDPVEVWPDPLTKFTALNSDERRGMGTYFEKALLKALKRSHVIVDRSGPGVLRIRATITGISAQTATPSIKANTPATYVHAKLRRMARREISSIEATVSIKVVDSETGEHLADLFDERTGRGIVHPSNRVWEHIRPALDYWAERLEVALALSTKRPIESGQVLDPVRFRWLSDGAISVDHAPSPVRALKESNIDRSAEQ